MNTIFVLLICIYVTVKVIFFVALYIGTKAVERKALEKKKQFEIENRPLDPDTRSIGSAREKRSLESGNRYIFKQEISD